MHKPIPDFLARSREHQNALGDVGTQNIMNAGRHWRLAPVLTSGGAIVFPHATLSVCGHQIAAAVHGCLDSGATTVLALGVLHALTPELQAARQRILEGSNPAAEPTWGIQGPELDGRGDWRTEFSLSHFEYLWSYEIRRRGLTAPPKLIIRYPYLAAGQPLRLPGYAELEDIARRAVVVATVDPFHHGVGYGDGTETALEPQSGGLQLAASKIAEGMEMLCSAKYADYNQHCAEWRSDGRDVGQVLAQIVSPRQFEILDLVADDMSGPYGSPSPTWVAGALITLSQ